MFAHINPCPTPIFSCIVWVSESGMQRTGSLGFMAVGVRPWKRTGAGGQGDWLTISYQVSRGIQLLSASRILLVEMIYSNTLMATKHDF